MSLLRNFLITHCQNLDSESYLAAISRPKLTAKEIIYNKIEEMADDYDKREELLDEIKLIKARRLRRARSASMQIQK